MTTPQLVTRATYDFRVARVRGRMQTPLGRRRASSYLPHLVRVWAVNAGGRSAMRAGAR